MRKHEGIPVVQTIEGLQVDLIENNRDGQERYKRQKKGEVRGE